MRRLLLISHRPLEGAGGGSARWRSFARHLPEHGWSVDVFSGAGGSDSLEYSQELEDRRRVRRRANSMRALRAVLEPGFHAAGLRTSAFPPSTLWALRSIAGVRKAAARGYDVVVATSPPIAALVLARVGFGEDPPAPLVADLRDLWAGNPAYEQCPGRLNRLERRLLAPTSLLIATSTQAAASLRRRHGTSAPLIRTIENGFEPELLDLRQPERRRSTCTIVHSGTLVPGRPISSLLRVLSRPPFVDRFRLLLHGYVSSSTLSELRSYPVEVIPPSPWREAVDLMRSADACLVVQGARVGDATAIAAKTYEYLALGKPVLAITDGGATEALLRTLGVDRLCARLSDDESIAVALTELLEAPQVPVSPEQLAPYSRASQAAKLAAELNRLAG